MGKSKLERFTSVWLQGCEFCDYRNSPAPFIPILKISQDRSSIWTPMFVASHHPFVFCLFPSFVSLIFAVPITAIGTSVFLNLPSLFYWGIITSWTGQFLLDEASSPFFQCVFRFDPLWANLAIVLTPKLQLPRFSTPCWVSSASLQCFWDGWKLPHLKNTRNQQLTA